jgi:hypothetical protein
MQKVLNGERPMRPEGTRTIGLTDDVWKIIEGCWEQEPRSRLRANEVVNGLQKATAAFGKQGSNR